MSVLPEISAGVWLAAAVVIAAPLAARAGWRWLGWWERPLARLARRRWLALLTAALAPLLLRAILLPWMPAPQPSVHDEFSFLLGADTLAHGRLANPQHPHWMHFESMHILARPTYASAFPLAPAAVLALGQVVFGHPWAGVWIAVALMCGATFWALEGWLPSRWALLGALLAGLRFGVAGYWMNSYWGGAVAAFGGALALGALPRLRRAPHWPAALALGIGLAVLANSRTFEGAVFGVAVGVVALRDFTPRIVAVLGLVLGLTALGMGYYFYRVTGNPLLPPYVLYRTTMTQAPHFLWQQPRPAPLYNNSEMRLFYTQREMKDYAVARSAPLADLMQKANYYWRIYFGPLLTLPFLALPFLRRRRVLVIAAIFPLALVPQVWHNAHYAAPAAALAFLVVTMCLRQMRLHRLGLPAARLIPVACAVLPFLPSAAPPQPDGHQRAAVVRELENEPGRHLVLVRYGLVHDPGNEWAYNGADIDGQRIVWARELDAASNASLLRYFAGRRAWLVEPDAPRPRAVPLASTAPRAMPFVSLGAPGIEVLRSPEAIAGKVLKEAGAASSLPCDEWNYYFRAVTGVEGPDVVRGCYAGAARTTPVPFTRWFEWLRRQ